MTYEEFKEKYQIVLNEQQSTAVQTVDGPVLLLAVPGSGKTTVLVTRLGYMTLCKDVDPENILTVTYTVAATKDMAERYVSIFGEDNSDKLEFRTINGLSYKIIQHYGKSVGKDSFSLATDDGMLVKMISDIYRSITDNYATESDIQAIRTQITYIKNMQLSDEEIKALDEENEYPVSKIYFEYCAQMKEKSLMDYDDQMVYAYRILKSSPETLEYFQDKYKYICVDEAQDTSKIQHMIIQLLASRNENIFMVGDEDQSIYGFRAAYPEALLSFEKTFKNAKILLMETNYRSNSTIVSAANDFIQKNEMRRAKQMVADREDSEDIKEIKLKSRRAQYSYLVKVANNCRYETAVLYRDNESIIPLIDLLERKELPYRVKNADLSFFTHRVVSDIRKIIEFAEKPTDTELFMQVYYKMGTFLSRENAEKVCAISEARELPVLDVASGLSSIPEGTRKSCKVIKANLATMINERADKAIARIENQLGYNDYLQRTKIKNSKLDILKTIGVNEENAIALLDRLDDLNDLIRDHENPECNLIFSTIHSSKGLEYDNVYLLDIADGIFPESTLKDEPAEEEKKAFEEERRLFYVGVTRAKNRLSIFETNMDSVFCNELFKREKKKISADEGARYVDKRRPPRGMLRSSSYMASTQGKSVSQDEYKELCESIASNGYIIHKQYGKGEVTEMDGDHISVKFADCEKKLSLKFLMGHNMLQ